VRGFLLDVQALLADHVEDVLEHILLEAGLELRRAVIGARLRQGPSGRH
jgi:hypothetical protein